MKTLLGLGVGMWFGYYLATGRHIWDDYRLSLDVLAAADN